MDGHGTAEDRPAWDPRYNPRTPDQVRLDDGSPLYHLFIKPDDSGVINQDEVQDAKNEMQRLEEIDPGVVMSCQGKTREEALVILASLRN